MAGERLILAVSVLFLSLSALFATFQCCGLLRSLLMKQSLRQRQLTVTWTRPRVGGFPHLESCTWQNATPADRVTLPSRPGNPSETCWSDDCSQVPVILPKKGHVEGLIISHFHNIVEHQGLGMTFNQIRSTEFWIIGGSFNVSNYISRYVCCRKLRGMVQEQRMANLPGDRVRSAPLPLLIFRSWLLWPLVCKGRASSAQEIRSPFHLFSIKGILLRSWSFPESKTPSLILTVVLLAVQAQFANYNRTREQILWLRRTNFSRSLQS